MSPGALAGTVWNFVCLKVLSGDREVQSVTDFIFKYNTGYIATDLKEMLQSQE